MKRIQLYSAFMRYTACNEHCGGEPEYPADALGQDCVPAAFPPEKMDYERKYKGDRRKSETWFPETPGFLHLPAGK